MKCAYLYTYVVHPRWYVDMLNEQFLMFFFFYISPWMDENYTTVLYIYMFDLWFYDMVARYVYIYLYYIHIIITLMIILSIFARSLDSWAMRGPSSARGGGFQLSRCFRCVKWGIYRMKSSILLSHRIHGAGIYANMNGVHWW
jgi:hypothetical protein